MGARGLRQATGNGKTARVEQHYLCPLALTGNTASEMKQWIQAANNGKHVLLPVYVENAKGQRKLLAERYTIERTVSAKVGGEVKEWTERVFVVRSETYRRTWQNGLERRLQRVTAKLSALTPFSGRGKRQIRDESEWTV